MKFDIKVNRILEMYLNLDSQGSLYPKDPETNKVIKSDSFPIPEDAVKVDQINGFDLFEVKGEDWFELYVKPVQKTEASLRMAGVILGDDVSRVRETDASKTNTFPVLSLYQYLILDKGLKLITDNEHSIGGKSIWVKLLKDPMIKFYYAVENKMNNPQVEPFSEWNPLTKKQIANPNEFWDEKSRYSLTSAVVLLATKK